MLSCLVGGGLWDCKLKIMEETDEQFLGKTEEKNGRQTIQSFLGVRKTGKKGRQ